MATSRIFTRRLTQVFREVTLTREQVVRAINGDLKLNLDVPESAEISVYASCRGEACVDGDALLTIRWEESVSMTDPDVEVG